jgi:predicted nuclease of predicted toxin-antitoxin system
MAIRGEGRSAGERLMRFLLEMNISPELSHRLRAAGHEAVHWSSVGAPRARDEILMSFARDHGQVLLTHDLDFGSLLALTHAAGPSVIQIRTQDVLSDRFLSLVCAAAKQFESELQRGALVVVDEERSRVRVLPIA